MPKEIIILHQTGSTGHASEAAMIVAKQELEANTDMPVIVLPPNVMFEVVTVGARDLSKPVDEPSEDDEDDDEDDYDYDDDDDDDDDE